MSEESLTTPPSSAPEEAPKKRVIPLAHLITAGVIVLAVAIAITLVSIQSAKANQIRNAVSNCDLLITEYRIMDDGNAIALSEVGLDSGPSASKLVCLLDELDAPQTVGVKISSTRALDGTVSVTWADFSAQWTFHPDNGLNILIERGS